MNLKLEAHLLLQPRLYDVLDVGTAGAVWVNVVELHQRAGVLKSNGACGQILCTSGRSR